MNEIPTPKKAFGEFVIHNFNKGVEYYISIDKTCVNWEINNIPILFLAIFKSNNNMIELLLSHGANPKIISSSFDGMNAIELAKKLKRDDIVNILLQCPEIIDWPECKCTNNLKEGD